MVDTGIGIATTGERGRRKHRTIKRAGERKTVGPEKRGLRSDKDRDPKHGLTGRQRWGRVWECQRLRSPETKMQRRDGERELEPSA